MFLQDLTYKVTKYTSQLQESDQRRIFKTAFDKWAAVTNLKVQEANNQRDEVVDILISFVQGYHTDAYPFDGVGGTLAHAFYPLDNKGEDGRRFSLTVEIQLDITKTSAKLGPNHTAMSLGIVRRDRFRTRTSLTSAAVQLLCAWLHKKPQL